MGNQQERPPSLEWAAGLIVGEGSYGFAVHRVRHDKYRITPVFTLGMLDGECVDRLCSILEHHGLPVYRILRKSGMHTVRVSGVKRLKRYCDVLNPLLDGQKKRAAELVSAYVESRLRQESHAPFSDEEIALVNESRKLNGGRGQKVDPAVAQSNAVHGDHQRRKTHCPHGHEYSPENTVHSNTGARRCKTCHEARYDKARLLRD